MTIKEAIRWSNGMVMVFDDAGAQVESLQGRYDTVRDKVLSAASDKTVFKHGVWRSMTEKTMRREDW